MKREEEVVDDDCAFLFYFVVERLICFLFTLSFLLHLFTFFALFCYFEYSVFLLGGSCLLLL
jgi:hypothetical protein